MEQIDCKKCEHCHHYDCDLGFIWASGAAGQAVDEIQNVWRCMDYYEKITNEETED